MMTDFNLDHDTRAYAAQVSGQVALLLEPQPADWADRLLLWLAECERAPQRALRLGRIEPALDDLVTFEMACLLFSVDPEKRDGLATEDKGGAVCALTALTGALELGYRANPAQKRALARRVAERRASMRQAIADLIAQRG